MTRDTDSSSSGAQGRGGPAYPSGTPPYGTRPFPSLHPQERPRPAEPEPQPDQPAAADAPQDEPKTETTLTTRIRINIPGSRPIPPVVLRTPVDEATAAAARDAGTAAGAASGTVPGAAGAASGGTGPAAEAAPEADAPAEPQKKDKTSDWFAPRKPVAPQSPDGGGDAAGGPLDADTGSSPYPPRHDTASFGTEDFPPGVPRPVDPFAPEQRTPEFPPPSGPTVGPVRGVMAVPPYAAAPDPGPDAGARDFPGPYGDDRPGDPVGLRSGGGDFAGPYGDGRPGDPGAGPRGPYGDDRPGDPVGLRSGGMPVPDAPGAYDERRPGDPAGSRTGGMPLPGDTRGDGFPGAPSAFGGPQPGAPSPFREAPPGGGPGDRPLFRDPEPGAGAPGGPAARRPGGPGDTMVGGIPPVPADDDGDGPGGPAAPKAPAAATPAPAAARNSKRGGGRSKVVLLGVAVGAVAVLAYGAGLLMNHADVPKGTTVLGVQIGNMTKDQAVQKLDKALGQRTTAPLTLTVGGRKQQLKPSVAGLSFDSDATVRGVAHTDYNPVSVIGSLFGGTRTATPVIRVDNDKLKAALTGIAGRNGAGDEPMVKFADHKAVAVPGRPGSFFDVNAAAAQVAAAYRTRAQTGVDQPIALTVSTVQPKVSQAELDRAVNGFGKTAMSGPAQVRADAVHKIPFNNSLPTFLTMVSDGHGKLVPHVDLAVLKRLYGSTFKGVLLARPDGSKTPVTPQDVATALIQALGSADPAGRTVTLPHVVK